MCWLPKCILLLVVGHCLWKLAFLPDALLSVNVLRRTGNFLTKTYYYCLGLYFNMMCSKFKYIVFFKHLITNILLCSWNTLWTNSNMQQCLFLQFVFPFHSASIFHKCHLALWRKHVFKENYLDDEINKDIGNLSIPYYWSEKDIQYIWKLVMWN